MRDDVPVDVPVVPPVEPMIAGLLPDLVRWAEVFGDPPEARLFPEEEIYMARAVTQRRAEFTSARWCARRALARLGHPPGPILVGDRGVPAGPMGSPAA